MSYRSADSKLSAAAAAAAVCEKLLMMDRGTVRNI